MIKDFMALYNNEELPELRLQYKDYAEWQQSKGQQEKIVKQKAFWLNEFADEVTALELPSDYKRPSIKSYEGNSVEFSISKDETNKLKSIAETEGATLFMVLLSIYNILLSKLSNQEDIVVGTPASGRGHADLENMIGMFVNTLPLRNYPRGELSYREFLIEVKNKTLACFDNQNYQYEELIDELKMGRDTSRNPLFDVLFVFQNFEGEALEIPGIRLKRYKSVNTVSIFDLLLTTAEAQGQTLLSFEYSTSLFKKETIERFIIYFKKIISAIVADQSKKILDIDILIEKEKQQLLYEFNNTKALYPFDKTIHELFEQQVEKTPDNIAIIFEDNQISYRKLNNKANQLAGFIRDKGVISDYLVGIMLDSSIEFVGSVLGVLKAGGAYLPIDPELPTNRVLTMLQENGVQLVISKTEKIDNYSYTKYHGQNEFTITPTFSEKRTQIMDLDSEPIPDRVCINYEKYFNDKQKEINAHEIVREILFLDQIDEIVNNRPISNLNIINKSSDLLYAISTSGSTGKPKGVMLEHKNMVNLITWAQKCTNLTYDKVLQFASLSFDMSYYEIFSTLLNGGSLYLIDKSVKSDVPKLLKYVNEKVISTLFLPTSFLKFILSSGEFTKFLPKKIAHIVTAGEQLIVSDYLRKYLKKNNICLYNFYGPSETHVITSLTMNSGGYIEDIPSIGKPISNTSIFIVDNFMHINPIGIGGELLVSGEQVGRGYVNREDLTREKFIYWEPETGKIYNEENKSDSAIRVYHTGDICRWLPDGNIEFLGRIDYQVKIRGYRIELGEIETTLLKHEKIKETIVISRSENGEKNLCAYYVSTEEFSTNELRTYLSQSLPDYMLPSHFVRLEVMPLTPNGKIDLKALSCPEIQKENDYVPPSNEVEEKLVAIWSGVLKLGTEKISVNKSFFELGGHSLKAITLVNQIFKNFNIEIPLWYLFQNSTIVQLSEIIKTNEIVYRPVHDSIKKNQLYIE